MIKFPALFPALPSCSIAQRFFQSHQPDAGPPPARGRYYTYLYLAWLLPGAVGPGVGLLMFHFLGNSWTVDDLRPIFYFGLALEVPLPPPCSTRARPQPLYKPSTLTRQSQHAIHSYHSIHCSTRIGMQH